MYRFLEYVLINKKFNKILKKKNVNIYNYPNNIWYIKKPNLN